MFEERSGLSRGDVAVLVVLAAILIGLFAVWLDENRQPPNNGGAHTQALNNLKQMALALHSANDVYRRLPPAWGAYAQVEARSIHYHLLPFLEQDQLYKNYEPSAIVPTFKALSDPSTTDDRGVQNFAANLRVFSKSGLETAYHLDLPFGDPKDATTWDTGDGAAEIPKTFADGTSNTIVFATRYAINASAPAVPGRPNCSAYDGKPYHENGAYFGSMAAHTKANSSTHQAPTYQLGPPSNSVDCRFSAYAHSFNDGGLLVSLADASVRRVAPTISPETWNRALHPRDGRKLEADWEN